ncbi:hypothetical protein ACQEUU_20765 [Nonomuraea sp. CA-218870]|uniref:hypothetical protein n=1 Tax=Nonomuraea sp. CA-218870 TaxID=3239998 RepID=UPI003D8A5845
MGRNLIRLAMVVTVAGSGLTPAHHAAAAPAPEPSPLSQLLGADLGTILDMVPSVFCGNRLVNYHSPSSNSPTKCVNGPENSGNSTNSGNYHSEGDPINSGNFSNVNGSTDSNNATGSGNTANGSQTLQR